VSLTLEVVPLTLDRVRKSAHPVFPVRVLDGMSSALVVFAAGFYGAQDAIHVADAGLVGTCVDVDADKLLLMEAMYPEGWEFRVADAFAFARTWRHAHRRWDIVTVDSPTNLFDRCAADVEVWCDLAWRTVVLGTGVETAVEVPEGWRVSDVVQRSDYRGGVFWTVLERC